MAFYRAWLPRKAENWLTADGPKAGKDWRFNKDHFIDPGSFPECAIQFLPSHFVEAIYISQKSPHSQTVWIRWILFLRKGGPQLRVCIGLQKRAVRKAPHRHYGLAKSWQCRGSQPNQAARQRVLSPSQHCGNEWLGFSRDRQKAGGYPFFPADSNHAGWFIW